MTRGALADDLKKHGVRVTEQAIKLWEEGGRKPAATKVAKIVKATGGSVTAQDLRPDIFGRPATKKRARVAA